MCIISLPLISYVDDRVSSALYECKTGDKKELIWKFYAPREISASEFLYLCVLTFHISHFLCSS
jgi:hypothetical protein